MERRATALEQARIDRRVRMARFDLRLLQVTGVVAMPLLLAGTAIVLHTLSGLQGRVAAAAYGASVVLLVLGYLVLRPSLRRSRQKLDAALRDQARGVVRERVGPVIKDKETARGADPQTAFYYVTVDGERFRVSQQEHDSVPDGGTARVVHFPESLLLCSIEVVQV